MDAQERKAWLARRQQGVTSTDIRELIMPWNEKPAGRRLYDEKTAAEPIDHPPSLLFQIGLATEPVNAAEYSLKTAFVLEEPGLIALPHIPWAMATLDRRVIGDGRPVQLKYTAGWFGDEWGEEGTSIIPLRYVVQTTWELLVSRHPFGAVSALSSYGGHRVYPLTYDQELGGLLLRVAGDFWQMVQDRTPPADDWVHPIAEAVREKAESIIPDTTVEIDDPAAEREAWSWLDYRDIESQAVAAADEVRKQLIQRMGTAETATAGPYKLSRKKGSRFVRKISTKAKGRVVV